VIFMVSGGTATHERYRETGYFGRLLTPRTGNSTKVIAEKKIVWAADNDAFKGFAPVAFVRFLGRIAGVPRCKFVAAPDVVCDADATLRKFKAWGPVIRELGLPVALVAQDGLRAYRWPLDGLVSPDSTRVGWNEFDALFIGGSTEWKESDAAKMLCLLAKREGKWLHMGRVNTLRRLRKAHAWGCDSVDGTSFSRWPDKFFHSAVRWARRLDAEAAAPGLFA